MVLGNRKTAGELYKDLMTVFYYKYFKQIKV